MKVILAKLAGAILVATVFLLCLINVGATQGTAATSSQSKNSELLQKLTRHSSMPAGDLNGPAEVASRQMDRKIRESHWRPTIHFTVSDPGEPEAVKFANDDSIRVLQPGQRPDPGGLPVSCAAIIIGNVTGAQAFATQDRSNVYSDYQVTVAQVLKQDTAQPISPGQQSVVYRTGGSIRFPSGHVAHYVVAGRGFPDVGGQYVFFLNREDQIHEYELETAYQFLNGVVEPLDGPGSASGRFSGTRISDFLAKLQTAIAGGPLIMWSKNISWLVFLATLAGLQICLSL